MPHRAKSEASKAKYPDETGNQASSNSGPNASQPAPLSHATLFTAALERQTKRAVRAAENQVKSWYLGILCCRATELIDSKGNNLFQCGDYQAAVDAYLEAISKYGNTAVLNSNLAAAYLNLEEFSKAEDAATKALMHDPKMLKARYRRGLARKELRRYEAAMTELLDASDEENYPDSEEDADDFWPYYEDDPMALDAESNSSDCRHMGNSVPCRFYNHGGCSRKDSCRFSHAPDEYSVRDKLGRNVCIYYLFSRCKFGDAKCVYSHDRTFLRHGWWDHPDTVDILQGIEAYELERCGKSFVAKVNENAKKYKEAKNAPAQKASTETQNNLPTSSFVLLIVLDGDLVDDYQLPTIAALHAQALVKKAVTSSEALMHLPSPSLKAVFVADAAISKHTNVQILNKLVDFARGGGSVVIGGMFSSFIKPATMATFFSKTWGLKWKSGSYYRTTFTLNKSHELAKSSSSLPASYSMKALQVDGFFANSAVLYRDPLGNPAESPTVQVPFGKGRLSYIGDVNWEESSITVLLTMLGLSKSTTKSSAAPAPATSSTKALRFLSSNDLGGVFAVDAGISLRKNTQVLTKLVEYAKDGGSVIIGGDFSGTVRPKYMDTFFLKSWGVPWKSGSYHRTTFYANPSHELVKANALLAPSYSMKALHVKDISPDVVVYRPTGQSRLESLVFAPSPVTNLAESPAVRTRVGKGHVAYIGDVNWEQDTAKLVLAMLSLLSPQPKLQSKTGPSTTTTQPISSTMSKPSPAPPAAASAAVPKAAHTSPANSVQTTTKAKAPAPTTAPGTSSDRKPFLMLLSLEDEEFFASNHAHGFAALQNKIAISQALTVSSALTMLDDANLAGVFVTDAGIVKSEHKGILPRLVKYVKQGGTALVGGSFSSFSDSESDVPLMNAFFNDVWGVSWKSGAYHRTKFFLNSAHEMTATNQSLARSYSMKALHLSGLALSDPVYLPADNARLQFPLPFSELTESPVVRRKVGKGHLGYVGDVDAETETTPFILAMCGLLDGPKPVAKTVELQEPTKDEQLVTVGEYAHTEHTLASPVEAQTRPASQDERANVFAQPAAEAEAEIQRLPVGLTRRPFILVMSFGKEKFFAGVQSNLLSLLRNKLEVLHGLSNERAVELLGSQDLVGVFITDPSVVDTANAYLISRLVAFTKAGGTVVMGGSFSSNINHEAMGQFSKIPGVSPGVLAITQLARSPSTAHTSSAHRRCYLPLSS
ncbi:hypothetical protein H0H87_000458 [Tephrocybe sp. NHM501043]|nr:hypothetical protein H0H87_000458 [Tephrocybe sp. NHM501043]